VPTAIVTTASITPTATPQTGVKPAPTPALVAVAPITTTTPKPVPSVRPTPTSAVAATTPGNTVLATQRPLRMIDPGTMEQALKYEDLVRYVGQTITIRTVNDTRRTGTLIKYTMAGLTLKLTPREGNIELSLPHNTVREVSAPFRIDEPFHTLPGDNGAKKN
jgi:hypothetical protein